MTAANVITFARIGMIPLFFLAAYIPFPGNDLVAFAIFAIAGITDSVDGYVARRYDQVTVLGKFIDPLADKLLVISVLIMFVEQGKMAAVAAMLIVARELIVTSLRTVAMSEGVVIAAGASGKVKTAVQMFGILVLLILPVFARMLFPGVGLSTAYNAISWAIAAVTVWSGIDYCY